MRRWLKLTIAGVVLAALMVTYFIVTNLPEEEEGVAEETIRVTDIEQEKAKRIELIGDASELVLYRQEAAEEEDEGEATDVEEAITGATKNWKPDYPYEIPLNRAKINRLIFALTNLIAERIIETEPEDLSLYGLEDPRREARIVLKDDSVIRLFLGNETPAGNAYYLMKEGDDKVYTVNSYRGGSLAFTLDDIRDKALPEINLQELSYLRIKGEQDIEIEKLGEAQRSRFGSFSTYQMIRPYDMPRAVSNDKFSAFMEEFPRLYIDQVVEDRPQDLSQYGLAEPQTELVMRDGENELHLLFGDETEEGNVYAKLADEAAVFTLSSDLSFLGTTGFELVDRFFLLINIDMVDQFTVETPEKTYVGRIEREPVPEEEREDPEEEEFIETYYLNGVEIEEEAFKDYYQKVIGLLVDAENPQPQPGDPEITIRFDLNKDVEQITSAELVPLNQNFYSVYQEGLSEFVLSRVQVERMIRTAEQVLAEAREGSVEE